jgi:hypothetical protein
MKLGKSYGCKENRCTACGQTVSGAAAIDDDCAPEPGDFSVCIKCGHIAAFGDDLLLRDLTPAERIEAADDEQLLAAQEAVARLRKLQ